MSWVAVGVATAVSTVESLYSSHQAGKRAEEVQEEQEKAQNTDRAVANEQAARDRRKQAQQSQQLNATIENSAANTGMSGSSVVGNAQSANTTQAGVNTGQINSNMAYGAVQQQDQQNIWDAQNQGPSVTEQVVGVVGNLAGAYVGGAAGAAGAKAAGG